MSQNNLRMLGVEFVGTGSLVFAGYGAIMVNAQTNGAVTHFGNSAIFGLVVMATFSTSGRFILAAGAFTAEVEREKIAEFTMRGKAQAARSGRLPQGTNIGIYGYDYDQVTKRRTISGPHAAMLRRMFAEFVSGMSVLGIANGLNRDGISTLAGSMWRAVTVRRMLLNGTYTERTVYRRSTTRSVCDPRTGKTRRKVDVPTIS